jgi:uncharacterized DUF497 family protein
VSQKGENTGCDVCTTYVHYSMGELRFEWDPKKDAANRRKHGVSFEEASTVFSDERALLIDDPDYSDDEERFILLGLSANLRTLVVCHCYREAESVIRLILARKASRKERSEYAGRWDL